MTTSVGPRRHLRPGWLVAVGEHLWVLDQIQPVAVVLDAVTAMLVARVAWPEVPAGPEPEARAVLGAPDGLWIQQPDGPVVLIGPKGLRSGHYVSGTSLGAVSAHGAWCAPEPRGQDIAATQDAPPLDERDTDRLHLVRPGHITRIVEVDAAVRSIRSASEDLFVEIETGDWSRRSLGTPTDWELVSETSWLRLGAEQAVPKVLSPAEHGHPAPPTVKGRCDWYGTLPSIPQLDPTGLDQRAVPLVQTDELDWHVSRERTVPVRPGQAYAVAVEHSTATERWRVRLGPGMVAAAAATDSHVWVALRESPDVPPRGENVLSELTRVDVTTGKTERVLGPIDITEQCWPLGAPPVDTDDYAAFWSQQLSSIDAYWTDHEGTVEPLSEGLSDSSVEVVGSWPDTALHVTFAWTRRPGQRLRRIIALYDELGRPEEPEHADISIMEDLETNRIPTTPAPSSAHLDM